MDPIPVSFKHNGIKYSDCYFTRVVRTGEPVFWHLYDSENCYLGRLRFTDQWTFDPNKRSTGIDQLVEFFGDLVEKTNSKDIIKKTANKWELQDIYPSRFKNQG